MKNFRLALLLLIAVFVLAACGALANVKPSFRLAVNLLPGVYLAVIASAYFITEKYSDFLVTAGALTTKPQPENLIAPSFLK